MFLTNLYADLQLNPRSIATYRDLSNEYRLAGMNNEADAFLELMRKKFNEINSSVNEKQPQHNPSNS